MHTHTNIQYIETRTITHSTYNKHAHAPKCTHIQILTQDSNISRSNKKALWNRTGRMNATSHSSVTLTLGGGVWKVGAMARLWGPLETAMSRWSQGRRQVGRSAQPLWLSPWWRKARALCETPDHRASRAGPHASLFWKTLGIRIGNESPALQWTWGMSVKKRSGTDGLWNERTN